MLKPLKVLTGKPIGIVTLDNETARGAVDATGNFLYDKEVELTGLNAVIDPVEKDNDKIAAGTKALEIPTYVGEEYATTELTATDVVADTLLKVSSGKLVKATTGAAALWKYVGTYANPYGVTMHHIKRIAEVTAA